MDYPPPTIRNTGDGRAQRRDTKCRTITNPIKRSAGRSENESDDIREPLYTGGHPHQPECLLVRRQREYRIRFGERRANSTAFPDSAPDDRAEIHTEKTETGNGRLSRNPGESAEGGVFSEKPLFLLERERFTTAKV